MRKTLSVIALIGFAAVAGHIAWTPPVAAQASCMHCNFARAKCNRVNPDKQDKCQAEQEACVKKCKGADQGAAGGDKAKPEDTKKSKK